MANFVDAFIFLAMVVLILMVVLPHFMPEDVPDVLGLTIAGVGLVLACGFTFLVQYPFLRTFQTIGKAFMGLKIISTNDRRPLTVGIVVQRELFAKAFTFYFMCLPVLFGKEGQHDVACETEVV